MKIDEAFIRNLIKKHNISVISEKNTGDKIVLALEQCPFNENHKSCSAITIRPKSVGYKCHHDSCNGKHIKAFIQHYEPSFVFSGQGSSEADQIISDAEIPEMHPIDANDLLKEEIAPLKFLVSDILPAGIGILAAPPKYYKSFLALQICIAISMGEKILDKDTTKTGCLYFDLESSHRRPQNRLKDMWIDKLENVSFITQEEMPKKNHHMINLATGFAEMLEKYLSENPDIGFVVIDVFKKIRSEQKKTQSLYDKDYADMEKLQALANKMNVCIFVLHHTTKMKDDNDPFNNMGGSTGLLGAVDYAWVIGKDSRNDKQAKLNITGRDIENVELVIEFDKVALRWRYVGTQEEILEQKKLNDYDNSAITEAIRKLVEQNNGEWTGTISDIIKASEYFPSKVREKPQQVGRFIQDNSHFFALVDNIEQDYHTDGHTRQYTFTKKKHTDTK